MENRHPYQQAEQNFEPLDNYFNKLEKDKMKKVLVFVYGVLSYLISMAVTVYAIGFIGNIFVSNSLDAMPNIPFNQALMINLGLLSAFVIQHSGMARKSFKAWLTKFIPASTERATFNLMSNMAMVGIFYFWQPMGGTVWASDSEWLKSTLLVVYMFGWTLIFVSTFLIDHFHLFGLKQVWYQLNDKTEQRSKFITPSLYKRVRHPLYVGWIIVFWATPVMTMAHLVFAVLCTFYILVAIQFEEKDLEAEFGEKYKAYKKEVPMIVPSLRAKNLSSNQFTVIKEGASS